MPHLSVAAKLAIARQRLSTDRYVSALLVVEEPDGRELVRAGGLWDRRLRCYVEPPPGVALVERRIRLKLSQVEVGRALARWIDAARRGDDSRTPLMQLAGDRGSGKTYVAAILLVLVALQWPGDEQFAIVLNSDNRREMLAHMGEVQPAEWVAFNSEDPRRLYTEWITGSRLNWVSAQNPKKLRQGGLPIRHVHVSEAHMQSEFIGSSAQLVGRNLGALVTQAFNPPTADGGNWTARVWFAIEANEIPGERYKLHRRDNDGVDHAYLDQAGQIVRVISPAIYEADIAGEMKLSGPTAYKSFDGRPYNHADPLAGGCVGDPPQLGWQDVTRELTARDFGGDEGADFVIGVDFQRRPGIIGAIAKLYRTPSQELRLHVIRGIGTQGSESAFSQSLIDAGFTGNGFRDDGTRGPKVLLVGDGTGARQNAEHKRQKPPSFHAMKSDGWVIVAPMLHHKSRIPWNPDVVASLAQMFELFEARAVLLGLECKQPIQGFPSGIDSFRNAKRSSKGKLDDAGDFQHFCDDVRYLAWKFLPRPRPKLAERDPVLLAELRSIKSTER